MKKIIILLLFLTSNLFAQTNIDSLKTLLTNSPEDTLYVDLLLKVAKFYSNKNIDQAEQYIDQAINLSNKLNYPFGVISSNWHYGIMLAGQGQFNQAIEATNNGLAVAQSINDSAEIARMFHSIGIHYLRMGLNDKALESIFQAIEISNKTNNLKLLSSCYIVVGSIYKNLRKLPESVEYNIKALEILEKINDRVTIQMVYNNLSSTYVDLNENDKAMKYINLAIQLAEENGDMGSIATGYHNKAAVFFNLKDYKESLHWFFKAAEIKSKMNNKNGLALTNTAIGEVYKEMKQYTEAIKYFEKAKEVFESTESLERRQTIYDLLKDSYFNIGDFKKAYQYQTQFYQLKDSIFTEKSSKAIAELNAKYEIANWEKENALLHEETMHQSIIIYFTIFIILLGTAALLFVIRSRNRMKLMNKKLNRLNSTKDKFFSIIAHDLINPLGAINNTIDYIINTYDDFDKDELKDFISELQHSSHNTMSLLQNLLTWSKTQRNLIKFTPETINVKGLINASYIPLNSISYEKQINIINNIPDDLEIIADTNLLATVFRNLISNALKFTFIGGEISISLKQNNGNNLQDGNSVIIVVSDNGVGMEKSVLDKLFKIDITYSSKGTNNEQGTGLGLLLCKEFVEMHKGKIWVESEKNKGSNFYVLLPKAN